MARIGRPRANISREQFEKLCGMLCTEVEIMDYFGVKDHKTLNRWCRDIYGDCFSHVYAKKSAAGKISLRRAQLKLAQTSAAMAIFLGKNYLGQSDKVESVNTNMNTNVNEGPAETNINVTFVKPTDVKPTEEKQEWT